MPQIDAFRGIRYNLAQIGSLSDVIAPPYDVIGPDLQDQLYKKHPANVIRLELNREEPGDNENTKYERAARFLKNWLADGILQEDGQPAIYVYQQSFDYSGRNYTRRGFMARVRLQRFGEGNIYPHEETHSKAKEDRMKLTKACKTNLSQIFGIYPDPDNVSQETLEKQVVGQAGLQATDHLGVLHTMWPVTDTATISQVQSQIADAPMFVADGHHRYETACNYRDWLIEQNGPLPENHPANYVLTMLVSMSDPGMIVLPTHRLLRGFPELSADELTKKLSNHFECVSLGEGPEAAENAWQEMEVDDRQDIFALYTNKDSRWTLATAKSEAHDRMEELEPSRSDAWRELGVSILHRLIIADLLGVTDHPKPTYVHLIEEVVEGLNGGGDEPGVFPLSVLVKPATVEHIESVSYHKERMPAKSTYFFPKLLSGMVFHSLH